MKKTLYKEAYIPNLLLQKSLVLNYYTQSLIRFSKKKYNHYTLDNYSFVHKSLTTKLPLKSGFKTQLSFLSHIKADLFSLAVPCFLKKESDKFYITSILAGLEAFSYKRPCTRLNGLILRPIRAAFFAYCLGVIGKFSRKFFLLHYELYNTTIKNSFIFGDNFKSFCLKRVFFTSIALKLKKLKKRIKTKRFSKKFKTIYKLKAFFLYYNFLFRKVYLFKNLPVQTYRIFEKLSKRSFRKMYGLVYRRQKFALRMRPKSLIRRLKKALLKLR